MEQIGMRKSASEITVKFLFGEGRFDESPIQDTGGKDRGNSLGSAKERKICYLPTD